MAKESKIAPDRLQEVRSLLTAKPEKQEKTAKIVYDGTQYSIRIPKEFAEVLNLKEKKDDFVFKFTFVKPPYTSEDNTPKLRGELIGAKA